MSGERAVAVQDPVAAATAGIFRAAPGAAGPRRVWGAGGDQGGGRRRGVNPRASGERGEEEERRASGIGSLGANVRAKAVWFFPFCTTKIYPSL
jgi:hypothetical protein